MFVIESLFLSVIWALVITLLLLALLYFLIKSLFSSRTPNPGIVIILFAAAIIFFWQSVRLVGACYAKGYVDDVSEIVSGLTQNGGKLSEQTTYTVNDLEKIRNEVSESYPFLQAYINEIDLKGLNNKGVVDAIQSMAYKKLNRYIWARAGWLLAGVIVAFGVLYYVHSVSASKKRASTRRRYHDWN